MVFSKIKHDMFLLYWQERFGFWKLTKIPGEIQVDEWQTKGLSPGVAVKCVEIWRNTGGEGGPLDED